MPTRRRLLGVAAALPLVGLSRLRAAGPFAPLDKLMTEFRDETGVTGASLAVGRAGRVVYAKGFGYADSAQKEAVKPESLFRIASCSKPFTAVAVLKLVEAGKLKLDDAVVDRIKLKPFVAKGELVDERWKKITVRHCLQHTGGWDKGKSGDPVGQTWDMARAMRIPKPIPADQVVRYVMGQKLDFTPGERHEYANIGYCILGRVIAAVSGMTYEAFVQREVLKPLKITTMKLGRALAENRHKNEVQYIDTQKRTGVSLYPPKAGKTVPFQYGAENFEAFDAFGGWVASASDLVTFAGAFADVKKSPLLKPETIAQMWARPEGKAGQERDGKPKAQYYGMGWGVRADGERLNVWHNGMIVGSESLVFRRHDGVCWAVLFNGNRDGERDSLGGLLNQRLYEAIDKIADWSA